MILSNISPSATSLNERFAVTHIFRFDLSYYHHHSNHQDYRNAKRRRQQRRSDRSLPEKTNQTSSRAPFNKSSNNDSHINPRSKPHPLPLPLFFTPLVASQAAPPLTTNNAVSGCVQFGFLLDRGRRKHCHFIPKFARDQTGRLHRL